MDVGPEGGAVTGSALTARAAAPLLAGQTASCNRLGLIAQLQATESWPGMQEDPWLAGTVAGASRLQIALQVALQATWRLQWNPMLK